MYEVLTIGLTWLNLASFSCLRIRDESFFKDNISGSSGFAMHSISANLISFIQISDQKSEWLLLKCQDRSFAIYLRAWACYDWADLTCRFIEPRFQVERPFQCSGFWSLAGIFFRCQVSCIAYPQKIDSVNGISANNLCISALTDYISA